jgi:hypothetical protein
LTKVRSKLLRCSQRWRLYFSFKWDLLIAIIFVNQHLILLWLTQSSKMTWK